MDERSTLLASYFRQQADLDMPPYVFSRPYDVGPPSAAKRPSGSKSPYPAARSVHAQKPAVSVKEVVSAPPAPKATGMPLLASKFKKAASLAGTAPVPITGKRAKLAGLLSEVKTCQQCPLGKLRKNFVFGSGNAEARFMVVGEAPGEEEDDQGLPFVGAAGELLTKMLAAIDIDRKKHVFITNTVKCRPPQNRNPEDREILACSSILDRQMEIIAPKVLLLLGKVAAHALLKTADSIASLRGATHTCKGIPTFVTYHPAALLRNDSYRRPAWEDLKKLQQTLKEAGIYGEPAN